MSGKILKFVLFEGPDNVGKTTVVEELCKRMNLTRYHGPVPPKTGVDDWYAKRIKSVLLKASSDNTDGVVFDRLHLSDKAYAGVFGNGRLSPEAYRLFDDMLQKLRCKLVLLYDEPAAVHDRLVKEGKDNLTHEQVRNIVVRYGQAYAETLIKNKRRYKLTDLGGIMVVGGKTTFKPGQGFEDLVEWILS